MHRTLIVAKIAPGAETAVARIFAESDRTHLPEIAGVVRRSLYSLGDLYVHLLETQDAGRAVLDEVRSDEEFVRVSERLTPFIRPYLDTWASPPDAVAHRFYHFERSPDRGHGASA
jgi:cyclase